VLRGKKAVARQHLIEHLSETAPPPLVIPRIKGGNGGVPGKGIGIY
jgi:hypothetical protein